MSDFERPHNGNFTPPVDTAEIQATLAEVQVLDPELLARPATRQLVEMGAQFGAEVTERFGTPDRPKWADGTVEQGVFMSYHNGGSDGHTSVGPKGAGVPRNVLRIAHAVNDAAGIEVFDPMMRAVAFYAAEAHDEKQLCGRTLLPEGQGASNGDERMSAEEARDRYLAAGGDAAIAQEVYDGVMATAFNPQTSAQNVDYTVWRQNRSDPTLTRKVLGQEVVAAADLLGNPTSQRGPRGGIEYCLEAMCLGQKGRMTQARMEARGIDPAFITSIEQMLEVVAGDDVLRQGFADAMAGNVAFLSGHLAFSDEAIRVACGKSIDDLFPRDRNIAIARQYSDALQAGVSPLAIWQQAQIDSGY